MIRSDDRGFTLIEVLLVCVIGLLLLGGTLSVFERFIVTQHDLDRTNETVEQARTGLEGAARELRNVGSQDQAADTIAIAQPYDLIFQTSEPTRRWERYCLDTTGAGGAGASATRGQLWRSETTTGTLPAGGAGACPGTGWSSRRVVADYVTNRMAGKDRPIFAYSCAPTAPAGCPATPADNRKITSVAPTLYLNLHPARHNELRVTTAVFLRNENEPPVAAFTSLPGGAPRTVVLNASGSVDPEGRTLLYDWFRGSASFTLTPNQVCDPDVFKTLALPSGVTYLGEGVMLRYQFPTAVPSLSTQPIRLVVRDPGCQYDTTVQDVKVP